MHATVNPCIASFLASEHGPTTSFLQLSRPPEKFIREQLVLQCSCLFRAVIVCEKAEWDGMRWHVRGVERGFRCLAVMDWKRGNLRRSGRGVRENYVTVVAVSITHQ